MSFLEIEDANKKAISFGTTLDRGLFPHVCNPDRTGNELNPMKGAPNRGPGCYDNAKVSTFTYDLDKWICSKKGYTYGSRTNPRFKKIHEFLTPSPNEYQTKWTEPRKVKSAYKPFETSDKRFNQPVLDPMLTPGPGCYEHELVRNRKITWPSCFGAPIKPIQPSMERRTLKTELMGDKEYRKFRNRVAYFSLYFD